MIEEWYLRVGIVRGLRMVARGRMHGAACLSDGAIERVDGSGSSEYG